MRSAGHYSRHDGINLFQFVFALCYSCLKDSFNVQSILLKVINLLYVTFLPMRLQALLYSKATNLFIISDVCLVCSCLKTGSGFPVVTYFACDLMKYLGENVLSYTLFNLKVRKLILVVGDLTFLCASRTSWDSYLKNIFILLLLYNKYSYYHWFSSHAFSHMCEACLICCPCKNASSNQTVSGNTSTCNL